jgi:site-specific DNA recombinase
MINSSKDAVIYARVSSKDQEREGYSIPAQLKLLREYAQRNDLEVVREFIDVETAKMAGRRNFGEMLQFFSKNPACRVLIVEKTDRLYRNFRDCVTLEELDVEIHLPKEGQVISKNSKSQAKLVHGIQVVIARNSSKTCAKRSARGCGRKQNRGSIRAALPSVTGTISLNTPSKSILARFLWQKGCLSFMQVETTLFRAFARL